MKNPPAILAVRIVAPMTLELDWSTKETLRLNLAPLVRKLTAFAPLKTPAIFAKVRVDDWGHALEWPKGLDMGADRLYELSREQAGLPTASEFNQWMAKYHLSLTDAANVLGMTRRMMTYYRTGSRPIPKVVMLACKGWVAESGQRH
ncbi:MAG: DUF2442 domain-containing protein [Gallionella sp.]